MLPDAYGLLALGVLTKPGCLKPVVISKRVPVFVIKNNLRTATMSRDCYFELLTK
jgi:hypothetical protein